MLKIRVKVVGSAHMFFSCFVRMEHCKVGLYLYAEVQHIIYFILFKNLGILIGWLKSVMDTAAFNILWASK